MSGQTSPVVTRFAPSPTGALHVGGARTALFSWAYARKHSGKFILRFEDTDLARSSEASAQSILEDLNWLGIDWDEGPFKQSERLDIYNEHIHKLLATGQAYEDGDAVRFRVDDDVVIEDAVFGRVEVKAADVEDFIIRKGEAGGKFPTFHFAVVVDDALMGVTHVIRGQEHLSNTPKHAALYDALGFDRPTWAHTPSIMNPDGSKMSKRDKAKVARTYVNDHKLDIEDVARKLAKRVVLVLLGNPPKDKLDELIELPVEVTFKGIDYASHSIKLWGGKADRPEGKSCIDSYRDALLTFISKEMDSSFVAELIADEFGLALPEIDVADFRDSGYLAPVLCNYIALLGWNPGGDVEQFDMAFFVDHFGLERVGKANSKFDRDKLFRFNADAIKAMAPEVFRETLYKFSHTLQTNFRGADDELFVKFANAYQDRARTLREPETIGAYFFTDDISYDDKAMNKVMRKNDGEGFAALRDLRPVLEAIEPWEPEAIEAAVKQFAEDKGLGMGKVAQPLRVVVTGSTVSPSIGDTLAILGKERTLQRIDNAGSLK